MAMPKKKSPLVGALFFGVHVLIDRYLVSVQDNVHKRAHVGVIGIFTIDSHSQSIEFVFDNAKLSECLSVEFIAHENGFLYSPLGRVGA